MTPKKNLDDISVHPSPTDHPGRVKDDVNRQLDTIVDRRYHQTKVITLFPLIPLQYNFYPQNGRFIFSRMTRVPEDVGCT